MHFCSSIAHLEQFVQDGEFSWTVNSCGHFSMVITNGANKGGAGAKPLLGVAKIVVPQLQMVRFRKVLKVNRKTQIPRND